MKNYHANGAANVLALMAAAFCLMTISSNTVLAQRGGPSAMERRAAEMNRRQEQLQREMQLRGIEGTDEEAADPKQPHLVIAQVKQDFERIQVIYNDILRAIAADSALDYKFVADATAEIKKRASRLKGNLALPQVEENEKDQKKQGEITDEQIKPSLLMLNNHIASFVTNPLFEASGVLDVEFSTKASRDLKRIIEISDAIRKSVEKLNKAAK